MTVYETDVPGVGKKFEVELGGGERLVILLHHDGKRELFHRADPDSDAERLVTLSAPQARKVGAIIQGAYFQPVEMDEAGVPLGEAIIEWHDVEAASPLVDQTLSDAGIRQRTGLSVLAIQRDTETIANPGPGERIAGGDILVTLGTRDEQAAAEALVTPEDG